jgi:1-acyl-sn-glycerol-3-phosphate acyltransferase
MSNLLNTACNVAESGLLSVFADWKVEGRENVPPLGSVIVVANHISNFDPSLMSTSFPRRIWFLAKKELFKGPGKWFFPTYGAFPVNRTGSDTAAYRWALDKLAHGQCLMLFPEGTRSPSGGMKKAQPGIVRLAMKSQATIVPIGITGSENMKSALRVFYPTGRLRVNIGRPFSLPSIEGKPSAAVLQSMTDMIMNRIAILLPEEYQGEYRITSSASGNKVKSTDGIEIPATPQR